MPSEWLGNRVVLAMLSICYLFTMQGRGRGAPGVSLGLREGYFDHLNWSSL